MSRYLRVFDRSDASLDVQSFLPDLAKICETPRESPELCKSFQRLSREEHREQGSLEQYDNRHYAEEIAETVVLDQSR